MLSSFATSSPGPYFAPLRDLLLRTPRASPNPEAHEKNIQGSPRTPALKARRRRCPNIGLFAAQPTWRSDISGGAKRANHGVLESIQRRLDAILPRGRHTIGRVPLYPGRRRGDREESEMTQHALYV